MTRALYIAPDPIAGTARALELGCGWFPAAPPDLAGVPVPCAVVIGASGVQTFPEPLTPATVRAAITASVAISKRLIPDMNFDPSGAMESTEDAPDTVRLRSTMPDATSYTNR